MLTLVGKALLSLGIVAAGATLAVTSFGRVTDELGVPEYATSFLLLSAGTALPELIINGRAVRQGSGALALGGPLGSSLIDATLSLGIGPLLIPADGIWRRCVGDAGRRQGRSAAVLLLLAVDGDRGWRTGITAIALYLALFPIVIN